MRRDLHMLLRESAGGSLQHAGTGVHDDALSQRIEVLTLSLVVVTYRREAEVLDTLSRLKSHESLFEEIVVVDNGGSTTLRQQLERVFSPGRCRVIQPESNLGAVGRSAGILATTGDVVITLDDDVRLLDPEELLNVRALFSSGTRMGCVNFKILYADNEKLDLSDWCHPRAPAAYADLLFDTGYISEGACALHGPLARRLGAYPLDLHIGQEGLELAARILDAGYGIVYLPSVRVSHSVCQTGRAPGRQFYFNARNVYWVALRCYPTGLAIRTVAREWTMLLLFSVLRGRIGHFLRGCRDALKGSRRVWAERRPVRRVTAQRIATHNRVKPSMWQRIYRVLRSRTLD